MPFPTSIIEVAFDDGPYVLNPTWTDITSYVRSWSTSRGRSDDYSTITGSATVVLSNRDRRFDPFNTTGPYYGKLLPRRQIRIRATYSATTHDVFRGFTNGFTPNYSDAGNDSTVSLDCFDALQLLASHQLPSDWAQTYITSLSPLHYWRADDPISPFVSNTVRDFGSRSADLTLTNAYNDSQLAVGLADQSIAGDGQLFGTGGDGIASATYGDFSITMWMKAASSSFQFDGKNANGSNVTLYSEFYGTSTARVTATVAQQTNTWNCLTATSINGIDLAQPTHVAFVWNNTAKTHKFYVNGIDRTGTVTATGAGPFIWDNADAWSLSCGAFQQACVWTRQLTATEVQNIVKFSTANFNETTSARITRIIGQTSFSTSLIATPASPAGTCLDITDNAPFVANELQIVADTEGGPLFVSKSGVITALQRDALSDYLTYPEYFTSQATFGNGGQKLDPEITLAYDGDSVRNQVIASMSGGATYVADKSASQTSIGVASMNIETQSATYANARVIAERIAGLGQDARLSVQPFKAVIDPSGDWSKVLARDLFHRVTVSATMPSGSALSEDVLIRNITHDVTPTQWSTTIDGSGRLAGYFRADYSYADGSDIVLYAE